MGHGDNARHGCGGQDELPLFWSVPKWRPMVLALDWG